MKNTDNTQQAALVPSAIEDHDDLLWKETYSVGSQVLGGHHKQIFRVISELDLGQRLSAGPHVRNYLLLLLNKYAEIHFQTEEVYMENVAFAGLEAHRKLHQTYRDKIAEFSRKSLRSSEGISGEFVAYLYSWWIGHILEEDKKYAEVITP